MANKGLKDLKQHVEGVAQDAGEDSARPEALAGAPGWKLKSRRRGSSQPENWQAA